eukprot:TRINITY_DN67329_c0_g1_i1.p1 TRINITY_DN67329_c0_g1~~TRINITY_DN67329_c0_g1_i1.p1  ORF type:complete len:432 (+),score=80.07 TRINITY_DN67329_c0_g1_i1:61-1296(+)
MVDDRGTDVDLSTSSSCQSRRSSAARFFCLASLASCALTLQGCETRTFLLSLFDNEPISSTLRAVREYRGFDDRWYATKDEETGKYFFWNKKLNCTQYEMPLDGLQQFHDTGMFKDRGNVMMEIILGRNIVGRDETLASNISKAAFLKRVGKSAASEKAFDGFDADGEGSISPMEIETYNGSLINVMHSLPESKLKTPLLASAALLREGRLFTALYKSLYYQYARYTGRLFEQSYEMVGDLGSNLTYARDNIEHQRQNLEAFVDQLRGEEHEAPPVEEKLLICASYFVEAVDEALKHNRTEILFSKSKLGKEFNIDAATTVKADKFFDCRSIMRGMQTIRGEMQLAAALDLGAPKEVLKAIITEFKDFMSKRRPNGDFSEFSRLLIARAEAKAGVNSIAAMTYGMLRQDAL